MRRLKIHQDPRVVEKLTSYPSEVKKKLEFVRDLIFETAEDIESIDEIEETLKWGEPSYLVKKGSTVRMDWKAKKPDQYAIYFKCTSKLVTTFRQVYGDKFQYEKNRAIVFELQEQVPIEETKECIKLALTYHTVKHLDLLGKSAL